jgi:CYTH domain-containing protein/predicted ATPase
MAPGAPVHRIVLTGGPCGGKSTALALLRERISSLGFNVYLVPEAPTLLASGGVDLRGVPVERLIGHEANIAALMMALEDAFTDAARASGRPAVVFCDRGVMDVRAYMPPAAWQALLDERGWTVPAVRDRRYDAVIHLVTAALGAEAFYTTQNNAARTETPAEARELDARVARAWVGHPRLRVIDNSTNFEHKVRRAAEAACAVVGVPGPATALRKYLVRGVPAGAFPVDHAEVEIELTYLRPANGSEARIRRRGQGASYAYTHSVLGPPREGQRVWSEQPLTGREYFALLAQADPARRPVRKRRACFLWEGQYFELDTYLDPAPGLVLLQVEPATADGAVRLPPFLEVDREVTGEPRFSNASIAAGALG